MSQAIDDALAMLDPTRLDESVEELLAAAETEVDRARKQELGLRGSQREPLLRSVALLGGVIVAAYASANPAQAVNRDELREELCDAAAIGEQERSRDPANHPTGPALYLKLHQAFLELHRRSGRLQRLEDPQDCLELVKGASLLSGEIASAVDGESEILSSES
jgi:hypothetical protein